MAEPHEVIGPRNGDSPLEYEVVQPGGIEPQTVVAHYDGSGASGSWLAALTIRAQNGTILGRLFPSETLAAGDSADVTFGPFLKRSGASAPSGGLQFDTDPQTGGYLLAETTSTLPSGIGSGYGIVFRPSDGYFVYTASAVYIEGDSGVSLTANGGNVAITASGAGKRIDMTAPDVHVVTDAAEMRFNPGGGASLIYTAYTGATKLVLAAGSVLTVYGSNGTSKYFEVRDDGSVHIKTGTAVIADL